MKDRRQNDDKMMFLLGEISSDVKGINARLDKVNGRLDKHDIKIDVLESEKDQELGKAKVHAWVAGGFSSIVVAVILTMLGIRK